MPHGPAPAADGDFSSLFLFLPIGAYRSTPAGRQLRANPALVALNGYDTEAEMLAAVQDIGFEWYVEPTRRAEFRAALEAQGTVRNFESQVVRHRTRERIWVSENAHVVRGADGAVLYYEGTVEDITERVLARQALQDSQAQLQQILELIPGMLYRVLLLPDGERRATFVSPGIRQLYGVEPDAALADGNLINRMRHPDDRARIAAQSEEASRRHLAMEIEFRIVLPGGEQKWVHAISAPAPDDRDGNAVRVGVVFDISARKRAEQALLENSEVWKRALESSGDGVWDWHIDRAHETLSPKLLALYGYDPGELPPSPTALDDITHPDDVARMVQARDAHFAGRTPAYVNEHRIRCKNGQWKWVLSRGIVISRDAGGKPLRMVGTHTDITMAKQAEALRRERDSAAAADQAKSQFLSRVSHELRTPLNAILGFSQLLELEMGDGARQRMWLSQVLASGNHLLSLMDDILDLSSVQTGQLPVSREPVLLRPVLDEALAMVAGMAQQADVRLVDELLPDSGWRVLADRKRIKQIVSNLLSNAIKYNHPGGWLRISASAAGLDMLLHVSDSGQGMDAAQLTRLFQPFERLGAQRGPVAGTGLGLALSRQLAQAMGGDIAVHSVPGQGSTFTLRLPAG